MRSLAISVLGFLLFGAPLAAQTINASDCTQSAVQTAFNSVTASTTLVNIPSGVSSHCIWSSTVSLTVPPGSTGLTIKGAGTCTGDGRTNTLSCNDATSIADNMPNISGNPDNPVLSISTQTGVPLTIAGLTITGTGVSPVQTYAGAINVYGGSQSIRFTQDHFVNMNQVTMGLFNGNGGVVDHSIISQANASIFARTQAATTNDWGGQLPWAAATNLGTLNQWYFEDDELIGGSTDCDRGGRFVVRYNTFIAGTGTAQWLLTHPTGEPGGAIRGCRAWEAYENTFKTNGQGVFSLWFLSAGTGVTWGNTIDTSGGGSLSDFFTFISERSQNQTYSQTAVPNGWGYCGTYFNGTGSSWDQNSNTTSGYACLDNPGRGQGDLLTASGTISFPTIANTVLGGQTWPRQALEPIYEWMDTYSPGTWANNSQYSMISPMPLNQNVDYYLWCNSSSTTGCTSFNGTVGVGSGTLASRPSTCTTGVAYWATDQGNWNQSGSGGQGQLYKCTATNTWSTLYTPGTYPNPLVTGGSSGISLTVSTGGSGTGNVTGTNSTSGNYPSGTTIGPLTATATGGSTFSGWSVSGSAGCSGTTNPCPSFSLTTATSVTANFSGGTSTCGNPTQNAPNYSGTYTVPPTVLPLSIGFTSPTSGCNMFMTLDGSVPTCASAAYSAQSITVTTVMRVIACQTGYTSSTVMGGTWTIVNSGPTVTSVTGVKLTGVGIR
jgi:hypothetical protein